MRKKESNLAVWDCGHSSAEESVSFRTMSALNAGNAIGLGVARENNIFPELRPIFDRSPARKPFLQTEGRKDINLVSLHNVRRHSSDARDIDN